MTTKPDYQLALIAAAEVGGKPVHDLMVGCSKSKPHYGTAAYGRDWVCSECNGEFDFKRPNPDPMALIAACHAQDWFVTFHGGGGVSVTARPRPLKPYWGRGFTNEATLIDAVFQATLTVADNLGRCRCANDSEELICLKCAVHRGDLCSPDCLGCHGTGYVLTGERETI